MFRSDYDLIILHSNHLPILPLLLASGQSPLNNVIIREEVDNDVVSRVDLYAHFPAAADNVLGIESQPFLAASTLHLCHFLCDHFLPPSHKQEVLLHLSESPSSFLASN